MKSQMMILKALYLKGTLIFMNAAPHPLTVTVACGESFRLTRPVRA